MPPADGAELAAAAATRRAAAKRAARGRVAEATPTPEPDPAEGGPQPTSGGYHRGVPGELFNERYRSVAELGSGYYSTVWLCRDERQNGGFVAVKIQKSLPNFTAAACDEVRLLNDVAKQSNRSRWQEQLLELRRSQAAEVPSDPNFCGVVRLLDHFAHTGPNGRHVCMSFECLGPSTLELVRRHGFRGAPLPIVRRVGLHCLIGLDYLHRMCRIIHADVKPENIVVSCPLGVPVDRYGRPLIAHSQAPGRSDGAPVTDNPVVSEPLSDRSDREIPCEAADPKEDVHPAFNAKTVEQVRGLDVFGHMGACFKLVDLGNACVVNHHVSEVIQTRNYRSPEVIIQAGYDTSADVWSLACTLFELATGDFLFRPRATDDVCRDEDHLAQMRELLHPTPPELIAKGKASRLFFREGGDLRRAPQRKTQSIAEVMQRGYGVSPEDAAPFADFLRPMLMQGPQLRVTAQDQLQHPWLGGLQFQSPNPRCGPWTPAGPAGGPCLSCAHLAGAPGQRLLGWCVADMGGECPGCVEAGNGEVHAEHAACPKESVKAPKVAARAAAQSALHDEIMIQAPTHGQGHIEAAAPQPSDIRVPPGASSANGGQKT